MWLHNSKHDPAPTEADMHNSEVEITLLFFTRAMSLEF